MALAPASNTNETTATEETGERAPVETRNLSALAAQQFGHAFKGEVPIAPPEEETPEEVETPPEKVEEVAEGETPPEAQETGEEETPPEETQESEEGEPVSTLDELRDHYQWDPEWLNGVKVPVKVDGKSSTATLGEVIASYQMGEAAENRLNQAKERAQTIIQEAQQKQTDLDTQFAIAANLIQKVESQIDSEVQAIDLEGLRDTDPGEYAARIADIEKRKQNLNQMKEDARLELDKSVESGKEELAKKVKAYIQGESQALLKANPTWQDPQVFETELGKIRQYIVKQGFSDQEAANTLDHRILLTAEKAMRWDELQAQEPAAKKKLKTVPKVLRPGAPKSTEQVSREKVRQAQDKLRKSGSFDDGMALLRAKRPGG